ncbi:uncharacterized protein V6R79_015734 [Siganus canaliculatus]
MSRQTHNTQSALLTFVLTPGARWFLLLPQSALVQKNKEKRNKRSRDEVEKLDCVTPEESKMSPPLPHLHLLDDTRKLLYNASFTSSLSSHVSLVSLSLTIMPRGSGVKPVNLSIEERVIEDVDVQFAAPSGARSDADPTGRT